MIKIDLMNNVELNPDYINMYFRDSDAPKSDAQVDKSILELLNKLYLKFPSWVFVLGNNYNKTITIVHVHHGETRERLGTINREYSGGEFKYKISNERIKKQRERGRSTVTKDMDKAVLLIKKNFYPITFNEKFKSTIENVVNGMDSAIRRSGGSLHDANYRVTSKATDWVKNNYDLFLTFVREKDNLTHDNLLLEMSKAKKAQEEHDSMKEVREANNKTFVILKNGSYMVKQKDKCNVYSDDDLPEELKLSMGMLKLAPDQYFISDIGYRYSSTEFLIIHEEKKDEQQSNSV